MSTSNRKRVTDIAGLAYDEYAGNAVAVVIVYEDGNHVFAKWGGKAESNSSALLNASLHIMQEPDRGGAK